MSRSQTAQTAAMPATNNQTAHIKLACCSCQIGQRSFSAPLLLCCCVLQVLDFELQKQLVPYMKEEVPLPGETTTTAAAAHQQRDNSSSGSSNTTAILFLPSVSRSCPWRAVVMTGCRKRKWCECECAERAPAACADRCVLAPVCVCVWCLGPACVRHLRPGLHCCQPGGAR